jgi:hypothetical protein
VGWVDSKDRPGMACINPARHFQYAGEDLFLSVKILMSMESKLKVNVLGARLTLGSS